MFLHFYFKLQNNVLLGFLYQLAIFLHDILSLWEALVGPTAYHPTKTWGLLFSFQLSSTDSRACKHLVPMSRLTAMFSFETNFFRYLVQITPFCNLWRFSNLTWVNWYILSGLSQQEFYKFVVHNCLWYCRVVK